MRAFGIATLAGTVEIGKYSSESSEEFTFQELRFPKSVLAGNGLRGTAFGAGFYIDVGLTFSGAYSSQLTFAALFLIPAEYYIGGGYNTEIVGSDIFESKFVYTLHDWIFVQSSSAKQNNFGNDSGASTTSKSGFLMALSTGVVQRYNNEVHELLSICE
jgi:hypothetical protein